ncbi:MAG: Arc family DNA-binding protein [Candidatus Zixiibacteriota bacterium]
MAERKSFLLRVDEETLNLVQKWANDEFRSLNGQIEFLLRKALKEAGRISPKSKDENISGQQS